MCEILRSPERKLPAGLTSVYDLSCGFISGGGPTNSKGAFIALGIPAGKGHRRIIERLLAGSSAHWTSHEGGPDRASGSPSHTSALASLSSPTDGPRAVSSLPPSPRWYPQSDKRMPRTRPAHDTRATTVMYPTHIIHSKKGLSIRKGLGKLGPVQMVLWRKRRLWILRGLS